MKGEWQVIGSRIFGMLGTRREVSCGERPDRKFAGTTHLNHPREFLCMVVRKFAPFPEWDGQVFIPFCILCTYTFPGPPKNEQRWLHRHAPRRRRRPKASPRPGEGSAAKVSFASSRDVKGGGWVGRGVGIHSAPGRRGGQKGISRCLVGSPMQVGQRTAASVLVGDGCIFSLGAHNIRRPLRCK